MPTPNHLHLWEDRFFYITPAIQSGLTARSSATLLASVSGRPFTLVALDGSVLRCTSALVAPHVPRQLDADGCGLLSLNIDPASAAFRDLSATLGDQTILPIDAACFGPLRDQFEGALYSQLSGEQLRDLSTGMVQSICGNRAQRVLLDPRVGRVLHRLHVASGQGSSIPLRELAALACLSPDRMTHLFREQTGMSIKRYLLWAKIRRTVQLIATGGSLTEIALSGGFTDAAHMSRTFQRYFGLPPSFLANAGSVAVVVDEHALRTWQAQ